MLGLKLRHSFLLIAFVCSVVVSADDDVEMHPKSQKVVENSPVIFTCASSNPGGLFSWYQSDRRVDEEKDDVSIIQVNDYMSVLKIERADIKRHKRTYVCRVEFTNGIMEERRATLKVMSESRLHKYFPHIEPITNVNDIMLPSIKQDTIHLKCDSSVTSKKATPTWRWIKDGLIDLDIDTAEDEDDRIEVTDEGDLIINRATSSDSGTYMCVAENNRGSAYGTPFTLNVQEGPPVPLSDGCFDDDGEKIAFGDTYNVHGDPCTTCTCVEGLGLSCRNVGCFPKPCPPGQKVKYSPDVCCETTCVPELDGIEGIEDPFRDTEHCLDRDGRAVKSGNTYKPEEDPCLECECKDGRRGRCMMVACAPPTCQNYIPSRDVCCNYTCPPELPTPPSEITERGCLDFNGRLVEDGSIYQPGSNPCETCQCESGRKVRCAEAVCDAPPCRNYRLIPGTCCGFVCPDDEFDTVDLDLDDGKQYTPSLDPCVSCTCGDGSSPMCRTAMCTPPLLGCQYGMRKVPGKCCEFRCNGSPDMESEEDDDDVLYSPFSDPCHTCECRDGVQPTCRTERCSAPLLLGCQHGMRQVPGKCCEYECLQGPDMPTSLENAEKVLGRVFVQQIGSNSAFIQWKTPDKFDGMHSNLTVYFSKHGSNMKYAHAISVGNRPNALLRDLEPNTDYHVLVNGTLGNGSGHMTSRPVRFSLDGRGRSSFVLSDATGQVFESRGSVAYSGYSLPRRFDPVAQTGDVKLVLNMESFHRVEVSRYNETPCMDQDCGLLRFYMYNMEGDAVNVMSLMFSNEQDFSWAKAHL